MTNLDKITIKAARVNKGLTQEVVSDMMGISKRTISAWENNRVPVPKYALLSFAYIYGLNVEQLIQSSDV